MLRGGAMTSTITTADPAGSHPHHAGCGFLCITFRCGRRDRRATGTP